MGRKPQGQAQQPEEVQGGKALPGVSRRDLLVHAALLGLSGSALAAFLQACSRVGAPPSSAPASQPISTVLPKISPPSTIEAPPPPSPASTAVPTAKPVAVPYIAANEERVRIGHLVSRAGFGATPAEMERFLALGLEGTLEYLMDFEKVDDSALETRLAGLALDLETAQDLQRWWLLRMVYTQRPLQEKIVLFWHGLLTSGFTRVGKGPYMYQQNQLFRTYALGSFDVLLKAVSRDPAMLIWLDSRSNRKGTPNENFARELMDLFTLGEGKYTEYDVREAARAFTGWFLTKQGFTFRADQHDSGNKLFLGRTGTFNGDDIIDIILEQPATGEHISRRLFTFFVHDDPAPETIAELAGIFRTNRYSIRAVMRHLLSSSEFYSARAYRAKIKSPAELVAGALHTLSVTTDGRGLPRLLTQMGQTLFDPPDVSGWPSGVAWINSTALLQRLNFAHQITSSQSRQTLFDPQQALPAGGAETGWNALEYYVTSLLDGRMHSNEQNVLRAFVDLVESRTAASGSAPIARGQLSRNLAYLVLASPDYQLS